MDKRPWTCTYILRVRSFFCIRRDIFNDILLWSVVGESWLFVRRLIVSNILYNSIIFIIIHLMQTINQPINQSIKRVDQSIAIGAIASAIGVFNYHGLDRPAVTITMHVMISLN